MQENPSNFNYYNNNLNRQENNTFNFNNLYNNLETNLDWQENPFSCNNLNNNFVNLDTPQTPKEKTNILNNKKLPLKIVILKKVNTSKSNGTKAPTGSPKNQNQFDDSPFINCKKIKPHISSDKRKREENKSVFRFEFINSQDQKRRKTE